VIEGDIIALLEMFTQRARLLGVRVERVADAPAAVPEIQVEAQIAASPRLVVSAELRRRAPSLVSALEGHLTVETVTGAAAARDAPLALTLGHAAYAETGSVLLAEPDLADRSAGMLSRTLIVVVETATLRSGLDDAVAELRAIASRPGGGYATVMTGPSRTADIERVLTVGVQGPGRVVVLFVDSLT